MITITPRGEEMYRVTLDHGEDGQFVETVLLNGCQIDIDRPLHLPEVNYNLGNNYIAITTEGFADKVKYDGVRIHVGESKDRGALTPRNLKVGDTVAVRIDVGGSLTRLAVTVTDVHSDCFDAVINSNDDELEGVSPNLVVEDLERDPITQ